VKDCAAADVFETLQHRVTSLEGTIVRHPTHCYAMEELEDCLVRARMSKDGSRLPARARLIYGVSGAGKSTLIKDFSEGHAPMRTRDGVVRPVVVVEMPEAATRKALVQAILEELGYKTSAADSANSIVVDIADKVVRLGVEMIILDEGQGMIKGPAIVAISEFLKSLLNRVKCQIVLAGCPDLLAVHQHSQLNRRLLPDIALLPYDWNTEEGRLEFLTLLSHLEKNMCLPDSSSLSNQAVARRLYAATDGCIGTITKYLSEALTRATKRGLTRIDLELLAEVYASFEQNKEPTKIDFDAELVPQGDASGDKLATLAARLRTPTVDKPNNPFSCDPQTLADLWTRRKHQEAERAATRLKSKGTGTIRAPIFRG
jgi:hypothetical protein